MPPKHRGSTIGLPKGSCWLPFGGRLTDVLHGAKPSTYPCDMPVVGDLIRCTSGRWMFRPPTHSTWFVLFGVAVLLTFAAASSPGYTARTAVRDGAPATQAPDAALTPDFATVSKLMNDAIAAHRLPGAVVVIGHGGKIVFHRAYGSRKLAGEPGLDGSPAPAEPMTEDTIFDMASLTKSLATATAVMQLYEQGKVAFDDPVQKYLPDFNTANDPQRAKVTVRMLLTHTSGVAGDEGDVSLKDPWGLDGADKTEGIHRALTTPLQSGPGGVFRYADINFILLGALIEKVTGEPEDVYVQQNVFAPLGMAETRYLPPAKACGPHTMRGAAIAWAPAPQRREQVACPAGTWSTSLLSRIAPTTHDDESKTDPSKNPDYDYLLRGNVYDPSTRRMGGVAGHAGVFSTAHDVSIYAQALLDRLADRPSEFPLKQATLQLMTTPEQPGHTAQQLDAANRASREAIAKTPNTTDPLLAPNYPAIKGQNLFGFGWDIDTAYSKPRGMIFPIGSFGHTGYTGTTLWLDPGSDTYVILLANSIHPRGNPPITNLRGEVATATAQALRLYSRTPRN
jgi:CubicO group peptidase (beta-lactamase class C family)